jgi:MSHA biogenesis protein MshN
LSPEAEAQLLQEEAQALRRAGKHEAAIGKYQQALARAPEMRLARLQLAEMLQGRGQADEALHVLKSGYERQPNDMLAIAAGRLLADQGERDEALSWLARGHDSLRPADFALRGALLSQAQRFDESAKAYQRALAADPDQGGWLLGLGVSLESLGRMDEARAAYRKALQRGEFKPEVVEFLRKKSGETGL